MAIVLLVRHGRSTANTSGTLAGRLPGVHLDDTGREQVARTGLRLADAPVVEVVTSPLERCRETAAAITAHHDLEPVVDEALTECGYGQWQGRALKELADEELWKTVQQHPSAAVFPGGEGLAAMQARGVAAIRGHDARIEAAHGPQAVWVAVSHGDVIKAVLADALGMHLDLFQRLHVDPASVSIVRYGTRRPDVVAVNTAAGDLAWLQGPAPAADAAVGGGAGPA
ncbi:MSMEG_4193 family putative phosphomutase [Aeromicrobium senzhongii]|uniref:MSMEG_4193 family putative phosphomutase n=1 Tax=Aeromicrobium senzhongii TaxID=2663859 RepID=A0ABX6SQG3_9ACTN|nr:histidine phosphatase family protein [Aeromicrobium senzhongii]MTB89113.1 MSMEG_4193 family putative phosphomutase [Aeromicrobium senzhongii]QNL93619.1 MSMEG_4193 family putative phosphomutase [Aeromicrobium senzhongii]